METSNGVEIRNKPRDKRRSSTSVPTKPNAFYDLDHRLRRITKERISGRGGNCEEKF